MDLVKLMTVYHKDDSHLQDNCLELNRAKSST